VHGGGVRGTETMWLEQNCGEASKPPIKPSSHNVGHDTLTAESTLRQTPSTHTR
jgi:hypothetical protein